MNDALSRYLVVVASDRQAVWSEPPAEISRLWSKKGARNEGATTLIRATRRLAELATFMHEVREVALRGGADLATLKAITSEYLFFYSDYLGGDYYAMTTLSKILDEARAIMPSVETTEDFVAVVSELALVTAKMDSYVFDFVIPWAAFGETFEEVAAARSQVHSQP